ncbi:Cell surface mannoprotein mp65 [Diplodia seriata]
MKASFFVQLALAIMFGLVAGLPQRKLDSLFYPVIVITRPAVIVHVHGTRTTWAETFATVIPASAIDPEPEFTSTMSPVPTSETLEAPSTSESSVVSPSSDTSPSEFGTESSTPTSALPTTLHSLSSPAQSEPVSSQTPSTSPGSSVSDGDGFGIGYNPYNADNSCKDSDSIASDISSLNGYGMIRLYGTDCNQLDTVMPVVKKFPGMKLFLGIWHCESTDAALGEAQSIIDAVNDNLDGDWSSIDTVSVGNEVISRGETSVEYLLATLKAVQDKLRPFGVPVVTVETPDVFQNEGKVLCQISDYTAVNAHPFFDRSKTWTDPSRAGEFAQTIEDSLNGCNHERTVIAETGWPHGSDLGSAYFINKDLAVPSPENHAAAIESLKKAYADHKQDLIVFSAYDDLWKVDTSETMGVEHYWGILN